MCCTYVSFRLLIYLHGIMAFMKLQNLLMFNINSYIYVLIFLWIDPIIVKWCSTLFWRSLSFPFSQYFSFNNIKIIKRAFMIRVFSMVIHFSGRRFYAHRIALLASSDIFRAMFDGGYRVSYDILISKSYISLLFSDDYVLVFSCVDWGNIFISHDNCSIAICKLQLVYVIQNS